jgi:hypothetical protein
MNRYTCLFFFFYLLFSVHLIADENGTVDGDIALPDVIITQVYGGGGNAGADYKNDFIELYNTSSETISLSGWSLQYYPSQTVGVCTASNLFAFPAESVIFPHCYFLVQAKSGSGGTLDLPMPDVVSSLSLSATAGKIALYNTSVAQEITTEFNSIVENSFFKDYVSYGDAVPQLGGASFSLTNSTAAQRKQVDGTFLYSFSMQQDFLSISPNRRNSNSFITSDKKNKQSDFFVSLDKNGVLQINSLSFQAPVNIQIFDIQGKSIDSFVMFSSPFCIQLNHPYSFLLVNINGETKKMIQQK